MKYIIYIIYITLVFREISYRKLVEVGFKPPNCWRKFTKNTGEKNSRTTKSDSKDENVGAEAASMLASWGGTKMSKTPQSKKNGYTVVTRQEFEFIGTLGKYDYLNLA